LHRNGAVFADPEAWEPSRWLRAADDPQLREMNRWFWAFGSGGRMCVGSNLALYRKCFSLSLSLPFSRCARGISRLFVLFHGRNEVYHCGDIYQLRDHHSR
jgi:hypothetical protein